MSRRTGALGWRAGTAAWAGPLVAMVGVAATILPRLRWINIYEDQAVLSGQAMLVAAGQVPYRDFFAAVTPGAFVMYAGWFKLFGATVVNERLLTGAAMVIGAGLLAWIGQRLVGPFWAAAVALLWGVWLPVFQEFSPYHFWSVTFILAMATALLSAAASTRPARAFVVAGLAASAALIMLQSSLPAVLAGIVVAWLIGRRVNQSVSPMLTAIAAPGAVVLLVLVLMGAFPAFITDTVLYTFQTFGASQALPFPWQPALLHDTSFWEASLGALWAIPMHWLLAVIAPIPVAVWVAVTLWRQRRGPRLPEWTLIGVIAVGLYTSVVVVHMSDQNFWLSSALTLPLVAMPLKRILAGVTSSRMSAGLTAIPVVAVYLGGLSPMVLGYALECHTDGAGFLREVSTPRGSICTTFESAPIVSETLTFESSHSGAIAFMPTGPSLYLITGRVPPVPLLILLPGVTPAVELGQVERLMQILPVEWVIYYYVDFSKDLPAVKALQDGSTPPFDQFLKDHYQRQDENGLVVYHLKR
jgi:hypothetical protein